MSVAAERRRSKRYDIELRGRIGLPGTPLHDCLIRDYCSGGMLIEWPQAEAGAAEATFSKDQTVELKTEVQTARGPRRIRVDATIAWVKGGYLGLSFPRISNAIVNALQYHVRLSHADAAPALRPGHGGEARCLDKMREVAEGFLPGVLREILVRTGDDLLDAADRGVSDKERQQIYTDASVLEAARSGGGLLHAILVNALEQGAAQPSQGESGELSLVDPEDFERWLEASRVSNLLEQRFSERLHALASRLGTLREADAPASLTVPFEPHHFAAALKDLAREQQFGITARSALFDRAARVLQDRLDDLYTAFDQSLDELGVAGAKVDRKVTILRSPAARRPPPAAATATATDGEAPQVQAASPVVGHPAAAGDGLLYAMDPELLRALQVREAELREGQAREMMAFVGEVPNVTTSLAAWLEQLNGLLVREAAADRNFFRNGRHPLREIVDGLGHLQMFRRRPDLSLAEDPLQRRVAELLKGVDYENVDIRALRGIADSLRSLTAEQSHLYQRNVERVAEASEGRDRVRRARQAVLEELNLRYAGRQVPTLVPELLDVGWRAVLELALLNGFDGNDRYAVLLQLLDALIGHLGGDAFSDGHAEFDPSELAGRIEHELAGVSFDPFRRNVVESRLRVELQRPDPHRAELMKMPLLVDEADEPDTDTPPVGVSESAWKHALGSCAAVRVGDHLHLLDAPEGAQDLRIAWIRADRGLYVLVDYRGLRVRDMTLFDLALGLHRRRIQLDPVDGRPLSERAVDAMLSRMEHSLAQQTARDSLTGLIGRQHFHGALAKAQAVPGRAAEIGVLLWVDVDQFRLVNDVYGYDTGDRLLVAVGKLLEQVKGAKVLGHLGSDRFGVLLPDIRVHDGEQRANGLCAAVRNLAFDWPGQAMNLSVSVGVVELGDGAQGVEGLLQAADAALAQAKAAGGDQAFVYHENDPGIAQRKESVQWVVRVDEALEHGELKLRCQPIVPVRPSEGLVPHYEVLLGVRSGAAESLPIAEFIEAAESYNRMRAVDRWVVRTTMEWMDRHRQHMPALHGFAVNLSGQTASDPAFLDFVRQQFQHTRIDPAWLSFEITETAAVTDLTRTAGIIRDLKAMGCMVALDDFGSGLASYAYLKELPVDWLKIDGAFVRKIAADREDYAVVKSINEIGHFLGKKTIAEYVADDEILQRVREIGVDFAQGYGISPPLLLDDLVRPAEEAPAPSEGDAALQAEALPGPVQADR